LNEAAGFSRSLLVSVLGHLGFLSFAVLALHPSPSIQVATGVALPSFLQGSSGQAGSPAMSPAQQILKPPVSTTRGLVRSTSAPTARQPDVPRPSAAVRGGAGSSSEGRSPLTLDGVLPADWYLAGVQAKVWAIWTSRMHAGARMPAVVEFTIQRDGSVEGIRLVESSGDLLFDQAALRTIEQAKPFFPLPKHYDGDRCTIRGVFRPE